MQPQASTEGSFTMITCPKHLIIAAATAAAPSIFLPTTASYAQSEMPVDVIASQLRRQGMPCTSPQDAVRERKESAPNATVWLVRCDEGLYRVTLVPNMAARVERVDDRKSDR
jgi:hypothetical protein